MMPDPRPPGAQGSNRPWNESAWARYGLAVISVAASMLLTYALRLAANAQNARVIFAFFYLAVFIAVWFGGRGPALFSIALSLLVADLFFLPADLLAPDLSGLIPNLFFAGISLMAVFLLERSRRAEREAHAARKSLETTLKSIGDAVISTDAGGRVRFMNPVAERLTGWLLADAAGRPLTEVFHIVNEQTREPVESSVEKVLYEGGVVGLANHTALVARDGSETPIEDSGAPIRGEGGRVTGVVLVFHDVGERRKAEAEQVLLAAIVESSSDAVIAKTLEGRITSWNDAAERMYGYAAEEALGRHISFIIPPELSGELSEIMERLERGERIEHMETVRVPKNGARLDVSLTISPIRDPSGRLVGASTIARDITEQKRSEAEHVRLARQVEHERGRLNNLLGNVPGIVWEAWSEPDESSQRINFVSDYVEQMLGYTVDEWLQTPNFWLQIVHPDDRERAANESRAIFESRAGGASQFRWVAKDRRVVHVEAQTVVVLDERGEPAGMRGVTMDITTRKATEERLAFLAAAGETLAASLDYGVTLERLARLSTQALADYCLVDLVGDDGEVRRVATAHRDPARDEEAQGLRRFPPDTLRAEGVPRVLRTGETLLVPRVTEEHLSELAQSAGHRRALESLGLKSYMTVPLVARERVIGALTFARSESERVYTTADVPFAEDIARRAALAIENARLYSRAQEVNRAKDEFLATLSHELRTPLTPILGWTHIIRSGRLAPDEAARGVIVIEKNSQSLSRLINDLLDMSSILSGKMMIERATVELSAVVREAVETVRPQAAARSVTLEVQTGGLSPAPLVSGDRTRLIQVFWNLLHNAVKFSAKGGRVRVRVGVKGGAARVEIEDDGQGIAPEFLPHVFERFRQADMATTRAHGGLGLGLALVKSFVEAHGGAVEVESAGEGRGSRFTVALPKLETEAAPRVSGDLHAGLVEPCTEESCHVLLIEDARDTLEMLRLVFEARGYTVTACASAEEALRVAETNRFDIIVSDIGLPRIDGYELIARLRQLPHLREAPALALTGYAAASDAEAALAAGFDAHVPKPVDPATLAEQMDRLIGRGTTGEPQE